MALIVSILKDSFLIKNKLWESNYRSAIGEIHSSINPVTDRVVNKYIESFTKITAALIIEKREGIKEDILEKISETNHIIDSDDVQNIEIEIDKIFHESNYINRINSFVESIGRDFGRYGIQLDCQKHRFDLQVSLYKVMVVNLLNEAKMDIKNSLKLFLLKSMNVGDTKFEQSINKIKNSNWAYFMVFFVVFIALWEAFKQLKEILTSLLTK